MNLHLTVGGQTADLTNGPTREYAPGRLRLTGQAGADFGKLEQLCPSDQERAFRGRWTAPGVFEFEEVVDPPAAEVDATDPAPEGETPAAAETDAAKAAAAAAAEQALANARKTAAAAERKRLSNRSKGDLQERAAVVGVAWDDKASRDTMLDRIADATVAKAAADAAK